MAGGSIVQHIEENLTYDYLHSSEAVSYTHLDVYKRQQQENGTTELFDKNYARREILRRYTPPGKPYCLSLIHI